jgi:hypothetical protein
VLRHQFRAQSEDAHTSGRAVSANSGPNVNHGIGITETQYERRGQTRKSGKGFQHREKEAQLGFSVWMRLVFANKPLLKSYRVFSCIERIKSTKKDYRFNFKFLFTFERKLFSINIYSEKFTVVSMKIEYSTGRRVGYRVFFNTMSCRFVPRLGSGMGISDVEISGIFKSL